MPLFYNAPQFPLNSVGSKGQAAFVGVAKLNFSASGALVGTCYGIPGVGATRVATGAYNLTFPSTVEVDIFTQIQQSPSGVIYDTAVNNVNAITGIAQLQIFGQTPVGGATGTLTPQNPASGTTLSIMFFASPVTRF